MIGRKKKEELNSSKYDGRIYFGECKYFLSIVPRSKFSKALTKGNCYLDSVSVTQVYIIHGYADTPKNRHFLNEFLEAGEVYTTKFVTDSKGKKKETERKPL